MVTLDHGNAGGERTGTMYATITLFATPVLDSQSQQGHLLFSTCPPTPTPTLHTPTFAVIGIFAPSTSQPRAHTPRTAPALRLRQTVTSAPARMQLLLHTGDGPALDLDFLPAFTVHRAPTTRAPSSHFCLPLFTVHLARTAHFRTARTPSPPLTRPSI
ncbi:hypothetical protein B0H13DRAFT_2317766 [Mycena leptocephala]|nr:hypothetical protein B0H13DRAFT_2317766 [Mycena leptocephala]